MKILVRKQVTRADVFEETHISPGFIIIYDRTYENSRNK